MLPVPCSGPGQPDAGPVALGFSFGKGQPNEACSLRLDNLGSNPGGPMRMIAMNWWIRWSSWRWRATNESCSGIYDSRPTSIVGCV